MIRRHYDKKKTKWCKLIVTAPDGRFPQPPIEGGLTPESAEYEAKKYHEWGMVVDIFPSQN